MEKYRRTLRLGEFNENVNAFLFSHGLLELPDWFIHYLGFFTNEEAENIKSAFRGKYVIQDHTGVTGTVTESQFNFMFAPVKAKEKPKTIAVIGYNGTHKYNTASRLKTRNSCNKEVSISIKDKLDDLLKREEFNTKTLYGKMYGMYSTCCDNHFHFKPEAGIHPRLHGDIIEFLALSDPYRVMTVVTDSSTMLLRLRILKAKGLIDLEIIYCYKEDGKYLKDSIKVDEDGMLDNWPDGFLNENTAEFLALTRLKIDRHNL